MKTTLQHLFLLLFVTASLSVSAVAQSEKPPLKDPIKTESGLVSGGGADVRFYKGIPFAAPPVGELRWRPPQPVKPWQGVFAATNFGPSCMQRGSIKMSEDCLTLNIWTSARKAGDKLPVMVWIYGGSFRAGSSASPFYDGEALARKGAVVVTLNYRVGIFGFIAHPQLTRESPHRSSGNYGLLDQIAALRWVQANISAFGGDAKRVTIFGESAGASSVCQLLISPLAKGLFQRAIAESPGSFRPVRSLADAEKAGGILGTDVSALRNLTAEALVGRTSELIPADRRLLEPRAFGPIVDGWVIPQDEVRAHRLGRVHSVPLLIGGNTDEGVAFVQDYPIKTIAEYRNYLSDNFGDLAEAVFQHYPAQSDSEVKRSLADLFGDLQFQYGIRGVARAMLQKQSKTFRYYFTRKRTGRGDPQHADEIPFVFGTLKSWRLPIEEYDQALSEAMMEAWVRFAATGDPNGGKLPSWPAYSATTDPYLEFGDTIRVGAETRTKRLDFLASVMRKQAEHKVAIR